MSEILIYHNSQKKIIDRSPINKKYPLKFYEDEANKLIIQGMKEGHSLKNQIKMFLEFVYKIQNMNFYKLKRDDKDMYVATVLALWKMKIYSGDDPFEPIWIAPKRKRKKTSQNS